MKNKFTKDVTDNSNSVIVSNSTISELVRKHCFRLIRAIIKTL